MRKSLKRRERRRRRRSRKLCAHANNCKGYKAIADLNLKLCNDFRTINHHFSREVVPGGDVRILTVHKEKTLVKYLINRVLPRSK